MWSRSHKVTERVRDASSSAHVLGFGADASWPGVNHGAADACQAFEMKAIGRPPKVAKPPLSTPIEERNRYFRCRVEAGFKSQFHGHALVEPSEVGFALGHSCSRTLDGLPGRTTVLWGAPFDGDKAVGAARWPPDSPSRSALQFHAVFLRERTGTVFGQQAVNPATALIATFRRMLGCCHRFGNEGQKPRSSSLVVRRREPA